MIFEQNLKNVDSWRKLMILVSIYQLSDAIIIAGQTITENIQGEKFILIYRIMTQVFLIASFHVVLIRLLKIKNRLINLITLLKCICVIICWQELDINIQNKLNQSMLESFLIVLCFVFAIQSQICQTLALLFNLIYSLTRHFNFNSQNNIEFAIRFIIMHIILQIYIIIQSSKNKKSYSNAQLIAMSANNNYSQMYQNTIISPKQVSKQFCVEISDNRNQNNNINQQVDDNQTESVQQNYLYEILISNFDQGIYIIDNSFQQVQIINPILSNLILKNEKLDLSFFQTQITDNYIIDNDEIYQIIPKFHRSIDIEQFLKFTQTLQQKYDFIQLIPFYQNDQQNNPIQRLSLFGKNISLKSLLDNLIAFNHLKYSKFHSLVDFQIKTFIKYENLYLQIILSPLLHQQKLYQILFLSDITNQLDISQVFQNNKNNDDFLISDISQKIRQPLNSTISMLEIIMNTIPEEIKDKYINPALAGCKLLINTANDILDYAQLLKNNKLELILIDIQIHTFISDILNVVKSQSIFRGLQLFVTIEQKVPQFIRTDPNRLRQILIDLLVTIIQAIYQGKIIILVRKSQQNYDHIDIIIKVNAYETNFQILKMINKTVRFFKSQSLQSKVIELSKLKQYSQSILIAFYLTKYLSSIPFEYDYERIENQVNLHFNVKVQNLNSQFNQLISNKRQSVIQNSQNFNQLFTNKEGLYRVQSVLPSSNDSLEYKQIKKKIIPTYVGIKEQLVESDQNQSDIQEEDAISIESKIGLSIKLDQMAQAEPQFFDYINEDNKRKELFNSQPSQQLTFGGFVKDRSSIYSSLGYSSGSMQPNDLLDCFEKMEKLKQSNFQFNCQCPKILICESFDLDLYAMSHQLDNLGILYEYITQKKVIVNSINKYLSRIQQCCKGLELLFIGIEQYDEELVLIFNEIKEIYVKYRVEPKIIALIGDMHIENRKDIMKLPFHDFLSKPIMIDALLFILTKWMKIS